MPYVGGEDKYMGIKIPENYKSLPVVDVSFQDQFCGCKDEITTTVRYVFDQLVKKGIKPKVGDLILLLEKDEESDNGIYYIANVGEIVELDKKTIKQYFNPGLFFNGFVKINKKPIMVKIDREKYFYLYDLE